MTRMSPPLRASNEGLLRPRVARAQGTHRAIPPLLVDFFSVLIGLESCLDELGPSAEIGGAPDLVGVVVVGAGNDVEEFWWLGRLEDLPAQFEGDNVVFVAVNDQLRERELRKAIDQCKVCPEQTMDRQPSVMELGYRFDRRKR